MVNKFVPFFSALGFLGVATICVIGFLAIASASAAGLSTANAASRRSAAGRSMLVGGAKGSLWKRPGSLSPAIALAADGMPDGIPDGTSEGAGA